MKLLIGTDGSRCSEAALDWVLNMRWPPGSSVLVVSSIPVPVNTYAPLYAGASSDYSGILEEQRNSHQEMVSQAVRRLSEIGLPAEGRVLHGDPRESLVEMARKERVDLIVAGSHGRSGLTKLLMGSVASHLASHAPCSVLVVKTPRHP